MALLTLQYTAPLPAGFTSGTVEVKSGAVYIDAAGRVNQPYRKYALNADKSLTSLQGDATPVIVGMAMGDPATAPPLDVVVTINVSGLPTPLRSTFRVTPVDVTGAGTLNLHAPSLTVPVVGPYSPTLQGLIDGATGQQAAVAGAITGANSAAAGANAAAAAVPGTVDAALVPITQALADSAQTQVQVLAASNRIPWTGGDHTTLPNSAGDYLITRGPETGQVWTRTGAGVAPYRNAALEALSLSGLAAAVPLSVSVPDKATLDSQFANAGINWVGTDYATGNQYRKLSGAADWGVPFGNLWKGDLELDDYGLKGDGTDEWLGLVAAFTSAKLTGRRIRLGAKKTYGFAQNLLVDWDNAAIVGRGMFLNGSILKAIGNVSLRIWSDSPTTYRRQIVLRDIRVQGKVSRQNCVDFYAEACWIGGGYDHSLEHLGNGWSHHYSGCQIMSGQSGYDIWYGPLAGAPFQEINDQVYVNCRVEGGFLGGIGSDPSVSVNAFNFHAGIIEGHMGAQGVGVRIPKGNSVSFTGKVYFEGNRNGNIILGDASHQVTDITIDPKNNGYGDGILTYSGATTFTSTTALVPNNDLYAFGPGDTVTAGTYQITTVTPNGSSVTTAFGGTVQARTITVAGADLSGAAAGDLYYTPSLAGYQQASLIQSVTGSGLNWVLTVYGFFTPGGNGSETTPAANTAVEIRRYIKATGVVSGGRDGTLTVTGWTPSAPPAGSAVTVTRGRALNGIHLVNVFGGEVVVGYGQGFNGSPYIEDALCSGIRKHVVNRQDDATVFPPTIIGRNKTHPLHGLNLAQNGNFSRVTAGKPDGWSNYSNQGETFSAVTLTDGRTAMAFTAPAATGGSIQTNYSHLVPDLSGQRVIVAVTATCDQPSMLRFRVLDGTQVKYGINRHPGGGAEITMEVIVDVSASATQLLILPDLAPGATAANCVLTDLRFGVVGHSGALFGAPLRNTLDLSGKGTPEGAVVGSPGMTFKDVTNGALYVKQSGAQTNTGWKQLQVVTAAGVAPTAIPHPYAGTFLTRNAGFLRPKTGSTIDEWTNNGTSTITWVTMADGRVRPQVAVAANTAEDIRQNHDLFVGDFIGATVTFVASMTCDQPNRARLRLTIGAATTYSAYHPGDGTERVLSLTAVIPAGTTTLAQLVNISSTTNAVNVVLTGAKLAIAPDQTTALVAVPINYAVLPSARGIVTATAAGATVALTGMSFTSFQVQGTIQAGAAPANSFALDTGYSSSFKAWASANTLVKYVILPQM